jgi:Domain of Unknown Function with PDB structure (DUF3857)
MSIFKSIIFLFFINICALKLNAQSTCNFPIYWENEPKITVVADKEIKESAFYVFNNIRYEFKISSINNSYEEFFTNHIRIHINDDKAVESFNKIEVPSTDEKYLILKARTITKEGKIINVPESAFKEKTDEETGRKYKIFAMEGMQPGCDIEYIYTMPIDFEFQNKDFFQGSIPCRDARFEIYAPYFVELKVVPHNGFGPIVIDTTNPRFTYYKTTASNLQSIETEKYCNKILYLAHVDFSFYRNLESNKKEAISWNKIGAKYIDAVSMEKDSKKKMIKYLESLEDFAKITDPEEAVIFLENHFKNKFQITNDIKREDAFNLNYVFRNKLTSGSGFTKLLLTAFQCTKVKVNLVLTNDKSRIELDTTLPSSLYLKEPLLYFPEYQKYIVPDNSFYRYPYLPDAFEGNKALIIKTFNENNTTTSFGELMDLPFTDCNYSNHNIYADATFDMDADKTIVSYKQELTGHMAAAYRPAFNLLTKEKQDEQLKDLANINNVKEDVYENISITNKEYENIKKNVPLLLATKITTTGMLEKAGRAYLFKVGKLIGTQAEMYQEKARICDIDVDMAHHLKRVLTVIVPEGYVAKNLDKLIITAKDGDKYGFVSNYTQEGNKITITIDEYYCQRKISKTEINKFRATINAAADFEKSVILLEKK